MNIRKFTLTDLPEIEEIYLNAREEMRRSGNSSQWGNHHPKRELLMEDIQRGSGYVMVKDNKICGVFAFILGEDPTYAHIEGKWLNDEAYGTLHRIAGNGAEKGILSHALEFCSSICPNIKTDTHKDNKKMRYLLDKLGFTRCGIIYVDDGTARIAYQKKYSE